MKEDTIEIVGFHPHIYFDTDSRDAAARVREGLSRFEVQPNLGDEVLRLFPDLNLRNRTVLKQLSSAIALSGF